MLTLQPYKIFLDDERYPGESLKDAVVVRDYWTFKRTLQERGIPEYVTFDHDLGDTFYTGKVCAELMINFMEELPPEEVVKFQFDVHSQNPIGARNIKLFLDAWLRELSQQDR